MSCLLKRTKLSRKSQHEVREFWGLEKILVTEASTDGQGKKQSWEIPNHKGTKEPQNKDHQWTHHRSGHHMNLVLKDFNTIFWATYPLWNDFLHFLSGQYKQTLPWGYLWCVPPLTWFTITCKFRQRLTESHVKLTCVSFSALFLRCVWRCLPGQLAHTQLLPRYRASPHECDCQLTFIIILTLQWFL